MNQDALVQKVMSLLGLMDCPHPDCCLPGRSRIAGLLTFDSERKVTGRTWQVVVPQYDACSGPIRFCPFCGQELPRLPDAVEPYPSVLTTTVVTETDGEVVFMTGVDRDERVRMNEPLPSLRDVPAATDGVYEGRMFQTPAGAALQDDETGNIAAWAVVVKGHAVTRVVPIPWNHEKREAEMQRIMQEEWPRGFLADCQQRMLLR